MMDGQTTQQPITEQFPNEQLVEVITYTASLVSNFQLIDPMLDTLRKVTARGTGSLSEIDRTNLHSLQQQLEQILVNQEQFRTFSYETLHTHIQRHFSNAVKRTTRLLDRWIALIIATALGVAAISFILLGPAQHTARSAISLSTLYLVMYAGTALLFASARKEVTSEVRQAYSYLAGALFCIAAVTPVQPLLGALAPKSPLAPTIMVGTLGLACIPFYLGSRKLALLTEVRSRLTSYRFITLLTAGAIAVYVLIAFLTTPFRVGPLSTAYIISVATSHGLLLLNLLVSVTLLVKARSHVTFLYARSTNALVHAFMFNCATVVYFLVYWYTGHNIASDNLYLDLGAVALIFESVLYLRAGYAFKKTHLS